MTTAFTMQCDARGRKSGFIKLDPVNVFNALGLGLANQEMVEVRPIPMRVGDSIVGTGGDEELAGVFGAIEPRGICGVVQKGKPALQSAGDVRIGLLPCSPFGQWQQSRQPVTAGELVGEQIRQRGGGVGYRKSRMSASLAQN